MRLLPLVLLAATGIASALSAKTPAGKMFPTDVDWNGDCLAKHREPSLWTSTALDRHRSRLRVSIEGINCHRAIVRIDETKGQRFHGVYVSEYRCGRNKGRIARKIFRASRREMTSFHELARSELILQQPRQGWNQPGEVICFDGEEVLIEISDENGYRAAAANTTCSAPLSFQRVATAILEIAEAQDAKKLLRP